jgi:hypothetical protein
MLGIIDVVMGGETRMAEVVGCEAGTAAAVKALTISALMRLRLLVAAVLVVSYFCWSCVGLISGSAWLLVVGMHLL